MPLLSGSKARSEKGFSHNFKAELKSNKPKNQALAIAYAKARESKDAETARKHDLNGYMEVNGTNISKVGVFPYSGAQIGSPELEPDKIYMVYRPEASLADPQTIESFKLIPFTDEHAMLGSEDGMMAPEEKGVHGVIGEEVYFEEPYLKANLKIFSNQLKELINEGKKELSIGYRCLYEYKPGVYTGNNKNEPYDFIQTEIRGNHLALVAEGRSGHDVAVLDHFKFTFDTKLLNTSPLEIKMEEKDGEKASLEKCMEMIKKLSEKVARLDESRGELKHEREEGEDEEGYVKKELSEKAAEEGDAKDEEPKDFVKRADITDNDEDPEDMESREILDEDMDKPDGDTERKDGAMDSKLKALTREVSELRRGATKTIMQEISRRDALAQKLSHHIGTFDHAEKTMHEVAKYGVKKLGLFCKPGHEESVLAGYLAAKTVAKPMLAQDTAYKSSQVESYLQGVK